MPPSEGRFKDEVGSHCSPYDSACLKVVISYVFCGHEEDQIRWEMAGLLFPLRHPEMFY